MIDRVKSGLQIFVRKISRWTKLHGGLDKLM